MRQIHVYLTFDGDAREAMTFYAASLGAELNVMKFGDMPQCPGGSEERVMHARLSKGAAVVMASDTMPGMPFQKGTNFSVSVDAESAEEVDTFTAKLGEGGTVTM